MKLAGRSMSTTHGGYTLVEMIIAMVLVSVLMSSVWTILSLYNSLLTAGRDRTTEQQLVRSLFELMHDDLAGVNAAESPPSMTEFGDTLNDITSAAPTLPSATGERTQTSPFAEQQFREQQSVEPGSRVGELSVSGTSTALRLRIRTFEPPTFRPASEIDLLNELGGGSAVQQQDVSSVTEFQTVVYQIISQDSGGPPDSSVAGLVPGLYRIQADTQAMDALEAEQSTAELQRQVNATEVSRQNLLLLIQSKDHSGTASELDPRHDGNLQPQAQIESIPEVIDCRFEYFDGTRWVSSWSKDQRQGVPAAIRVSLDVASRNDLIKAGGNHSLGTTSGGRSEFSDPSQEAFPTVTARRYSRTILLHSNSGESL